MVMMLGLFATAISTRKTGIIKPTKRKNRKKNIYNFTLEGKVKKLRQI